MASSVVSPKSCTASKNGVILPETASNSVIISGYFCSLVFLRLMATKTQNQPTLTKAIEYYTIRKLWGLKMCAVAPFQLWQPLTPTLWQIPPPQPSPSPPPAPSTPQHPPSPTTLLQLWRTALWWNNRQCPLHCETQVKVVFCLVNKNNGSGTGKNCEIHYKRLWHSRERVFF